MNNLQNGFTDILLGHRKRYLPIRLKSKRSQAGSAILQLNWHRMFHVKKRLKIRLRSLECPGELDYKNNVIIEFRILKTYKSRILSKKLINFGPNILKKRNKLKILCQYRIKRTWKCKSRVPSQKKVGHELSSSHPGGVFYSPVFHFCRTSSKLYKHIKPVLLSRTEIENWK